MSLGEDLSVYFDTATGHAVAAVYGGTTTVNGIFDEAYIEADPSGYVPASSQALSFYYDPADLTAAIGGSLVIDGSTYTVRDIRADNGIYQLILEAA